MATFITKYKTSAMSPRLFLLIAISLPACLQQNSAATSACDSVQDKKISVHKSASPAVPGEAANEKTSPDLPFFKEVPDFKRLFW